MDHSTVSRADSMEIASSPMAPTSLMTPADYVRARNGYRYPLVGLTGNLSHATEHRFDTLRELEGHQHLLLTSQSDEITVFGYVSVVFWGHYSGQDGTPRAARAMARARMAMDSVQSNGTSTAAATIRRAHIMLSDGHYGAGVRLLCELPQLQFAFASKVCAFIEPGHCGVIDSAIAEARRHLGFSCDRRGFVQTNKANAERYDDYCGLLQRQAAAMNSEGPRYLWQDSDGTKWPWRAVDIERALYSSSPATGI